jgi:hypothetical protein
MWHDQGRKRAPQREKLLLIHLGVMLYPTKYVRRFRSQPDNGVIGLTVQTGD